MGVDKNICLVFLQLTPVGLTIFRGIHAIDRDKPNTPNSDITYSIVVCEIYCKIDDSTLPTYISMRSRLGWSRIDLTGCKLVLEVEDLIVKLLS